MRNKDYRELQVSSSQLVLLFLGIIILGIVIFLLGVSVGKKHAQIVKSSQITTHNITENFKQEKPVPVKEPEDSISKELASHEKAKKELEKPAPPSPTKKQNLYYVQVGAFHIKESALSLAQRLKDNGYSSIVLDPFPNDKKDIYRIRIGGFETKEQAEAIKAKLAKSEGKKKSDYFIVRY
ncbi:MAG: SPOR domain-containing protein [Acidobacteriota bacterium]|nr:SPOR domain-containing protein [Acidobacteriota bacterium]